jgi:hypothetical protein
LKTRLSDAGCFFNSQCGLTGRRSKFPPQFGQTEFNFFSTHSRQNVHSKVQIIASGESGGSVLSQHSQLGRNSSIV